MAGVTNNGTRVQIADSLIPAGFNKPSITTFDDGEWVSLDRVLTIGKAGVDDANPVTTYTAIVADTVTQVTALLGVVYDDAALDVTSYTDLTALKLNTDTGQSERFTDTAPSYLATVKIFVKTA